MFEADDLSDEQQILLKLLYGDIEDKICSFLNGDIQECPMYQKI